MFLRRIDRVCDCKRFDYKIDNLINKVVINKSRVRDTLRVYDTKRRNCVYEIKASIMNATAISKENSKGL